VQMWGPRESSFKILIKWYCNIDFQNGCALTRRVIPDTPAAMDIVFLAFKFLSVWKLKNAISPFNVPFLQVYFWKFNAYLFLLSLKLPVLIAACSCWVVCLYLSESFCASFILLIVFRSVPCKEQGTGLTMTLTNKGLFFLCNEKHRGTRRPPFGLWRSLGSAGVSVKCLGFSLLITK